MTALGTARIIANGRVWSAAPGRSDRESANAANTLAIVVQQGRIAATGAPDEMQRRFPRAELFDAGGRLVTPGFIDCHTHIVHAGNRAAEFERRRAGESYQSIAQSGGGILSTVKATRAASLAQLVDSAMPRVDALLAEGVTTLEIKSGYGLDLDTELRMLRAARTIADSRALAVSTTYLGAHALPPEYHGDVEGYVKKLCSELIPSVAASGYADAFDAYCESFAFTAEQVARVFDAARANGLRVKLHADQLSNMQGARLAAQYGALSADHLEYSDDDGIAAMQKAGTVAVMLPGAFYFLREKQRPPVESLRRARVPMAVATDCNPGTSPLTSLLAAMNLAAVEFGLTTAECLAGVTCHAARALGRQDSVGTIETGKWGDLAIWNVAEPAELVNNLGARPLHRRFWHGQPDA